MNKKFKKMLTAVLSLSLMSTVASLPAFAESEAIAASKDYNDKINSDYNKANDEYQKINGKDSFLVIDDNYIKDMQDKDYENKYSDLCEDELFYTYMGAEISVVDENGEPFENAEIQFIERVDGGNDKYKVIESWNTSDEPVKKILLEDMMSENSRREFSVIINAPEGYTCDEMESLKREMELPKDEQPTWWIYCIHNVMSVQQTKMSNMKAGIFGVEHYYDKSEIQVLPEALYYKIEEQRIKEEKRNAMLDMATPDFFYASTLAGDANNDGEVSIADAILIMQSLVNPDEYSLTPQGIANADMNGDGITTLDALLIQEMLVKK